MTRGRTFTWQDDLRFHFVITWVIAFHQSKQLCKQTDRFRRLPHWSEGGRVGKSGEISWTLGPKQTQVRTREETNKQKQVLRAHPPSSWCMREVSQSLRITTALLLASEFPTCHERLSLRAWILCHQDQWSKYHVIFWHYRTVVFQSSTLFLLPFWCARHMFPHFGP